jgi:hypothetical protein
MKSLTIALFFLSPLAQAASAPAFASLAPSGLFPLESSRGHVCHYLWANPFAKGISIGGRIAMADLCEAMGSLPQERRDQVDREIFEILGKAAAVGR